MPDNALLGFGQIARGVAAHDGDFGERLDAHAPAVAISSLPVHLSFHVVYSLSPDECANRLDRSHGSPNAE